MEDTVIKHGVLRSWHDDKGWGIVELLKPTFPLEKFFLHVSAIFEGLNPPIVGSYVRFEVGPARPGGRYPLAKKAWILPAAPAVIGGSR